jgi:hypothetical protein
MMPLLNAVGIVTSDMARSLRFDRSLGVDLPVTPEEGGPDGVPVDLYAAL